MLNARKKFCHNQRPSVFIIGFHVKYLGLRSFSLVISVTEDFGPYGHWTMRMLRSANTSVTLGSLIAFLQETKKMTTTIFLFF